MLHTEKTFWNLTIPSVSVFGMVNTDSIYHYRLIWIQTDVRFDPNQQENGEYYLIQFELTKFQKVFSVCEEIAAKYSKSKYVDCGEMSFQIFLRRSFKQISTANLSNRFPLPIFQTDFHCRSFKQISTADLLNRFSTADLSNRFSAADLSNRFSSHLNR